MDILIQLSMLILFCIIQLGVCRVTKRLPLRLIPLLVLFCVTALIAFADFTGDNSGSFIDLTGIVTLAFVIYGCIPGILGAVIGYTIHHIRKKNPTK